MEQKVKFGIFADLHVDIMHDGEERVKAFIDECRKENVEFIIQLGDFCYPESRNCICAPDKRPINIENALNSPTYVDKDKIIGLFKNFEKPSYHVIGNHDCDMCSKRELLDNYGADYEPYYSFDIGGFHFVVLDPNYYCIDGKYHSFDYGKYFDESYHAEPVLPFLPPEQLEWLRQDLANTKLSTVLFSHQGLSGKMPNDILNAEEVKKVLKSAPCGVVAAFNGHSHIDYADCVDGIWFIEINSMSNQWLDEDFRCKERYTKEIDEKFPNIQYVAPYRDAVFAIVTMDENGMSIKGTKSEFVGIDPKEQGFYKPDSWWYKTYQGDMFATPSIEDRYCPFNRESERRR